MIKSIRCWSKVAPARFSNSFKAASDSNFSSGERLIDMAMKEMEQGCDTVVQAEQQMPDSRYDTMGGTNG